MATPLRGGEVATSAGLAFAHGSNDAQKTMGLIALALVAGGHLSHFAVPFWVVLLSAGLLTLGTTLGGWRVVRTIGRLAGDPPGERRPGRALLPPWRWLG